MEKYALTNCILLDGTLDMMPQRGKALLISGGRIEKIVEEAQLPRGWKTIDLDGQ